MLEAKRVANQAALQKIQAEGAAFDAEITKLSESFDGQHDLSSDQLKELDEIKEFLEDDMIEDN